MIVSKVSLDCQKISDWNSFHEEFAHLFGFPDFYGKNMDAWVDCMTFLDKPEDKMTTVHCNSGAVLTLEMQEVKSFADRCPEQYSALIECAAFVNWRRMKAGETSVLALSFYR